MPGGVVGVAAAFAASSAALPEVLVDGDEDQCRGRRWRRAARAPRPILSNASRRAFPTDLVIDSTRSSVPGENAFVEGVAPVVEDAGASTNPFVIFRWIFFGRLRVSASGPTTFVTARVATDRRRAGRHRRRPGQGRFEAAALVRGVGGVLGDLADGDADARRAGRARLPRSWAVLPTRFANAFFAPPAARAVVSSCALRLVGVDLDRHLDRLAFELLGFLVELGEVAFRLVGFGGDLDDQLLLLAGHQTALAKMSSTTLEAASTASSRASGAYRSVMCMRPRLRDPRTDRRGPAGVDKRGGVALAAGAFLRRPDLADAAPPFGQDPPPRRLAAAVGEGVRAATQRHPREARLVLRRRC